MEKQEENQVKERMTEAFVFLNEGFEEIEALTVLNILRRGGVEVESVSLTDNIIVKGGKGISVQADRLFSNSSVNGSMVNKSESANLMLIMPGGPGTKNYYNCDGFETLIKNHCSNGGCIAAICAAPTVLDKWGLLDNKTAVCYPSLELQNAKTGNNPVEVDGNIITSKGPATSIAFALEILNILRSQEKADEISRQLLL